MGTSWIKNFPWVRLTLLFIIDSALFTVYFFLYNVVGSLTTMIEFIIRELYCVE